MGWPVSHPGHKEWLHGLPYLCSAMPFPTLPFSGTPPGCGWTGRNSFYFIFFGRSVSLYFLKDLFLFFLIFFILELIYNVLAIRTYFFSRNVQKLKVKLKSIYNTTMQRGKKITDNTYWKYKWEFSTSTRFQQGANYKPRVKSLLTSTGTSPRFHRTWWVWSTQNLPGGLTPTGFGFGLGLFKFFHFVQVRGHFTLDCGWLPMDL